MNEETLAFFIDRRYIISKKPGNIKMYKTAILTISDRCFTGEYTDESGPLIEESLPPQLYTVTQRKILPDDIDVIKGAMINIADNDDVNLLLTTGGTGFSPRDVTPEATEMILHRRTPGIDFTLFSQGIKSTPHAMLSRAISGIRNNVLIINLPGNPKAIEEYISVLVPVLPHALDLMNGSTNDEAHNFELNKGEAL